jgi:hypothetical protein
MHNYPNPYYSLIILSPSYLIGEASRKRWITAYRHPALIGATQFFRVHHEAKYYTR